MKKRTLTLMGVLAPIIIIPATMLPGHRDNYHQEFLVSQLEEIESMINHRNLISKDISQVDIAWHLDHSLKVINRITDTLRVSNPHKYKKEINLARIIVWSRGKLPRGKAKSPTVVLPPDSIITSDLYEQVNEAKENLEALKTMNSRNHFKHPVFGVLDLSDSKKFIQIHTNHHLAIINDIITKIEENETQ